VPAGRKKRVVKEQPSGRQCASRNLKLQVGTNTQSILYRKCIFARAMETNEGGAAEGMRRPAAPRGALLGTSAAG